MVDKIFISFWAPLEKKELARETELAKEATGEEGDHLWSEMHEEKYDREAEEHGELDEDGNKESVLEYYTRKQNIKKKNLLKQFKQHNVNKSLIRFTDRWNCEYSLFNTKHEDYIDLEKLQKDKTIFSFTGGRNVQSFLGLKSHEMCWKEQVENNYECVLILEDDVILDIIHKIDIKYNESYDKYNFIEYISKCASELKEKDGDSAFLSMFKGSKDNPSTFEKNKKHQEVPEGKNYDAKELFESGDQLFPSYGSRTACAYLLSLKGAKKLVNHIENNPKLEDMIDHQFNKWIHDVPLDNYWSLWSLLEGSKMSASNIYDDYRKLPASGDLTEEEKDNIFKKYQSYVSVQKREP